MSQLNENGILHLPKFSGKQNNVLKIFDVLGEIKEIQHVDERKLIVGEWILTSEHLKGKTRLLIAPDTPLLAIEIHYLYKNIAWSAGAGWPVYNVPAPRQDKVSNDTHNNQEHHSILWEFGGIVSSTRIMSGGNRGNRLSEVYVLVNDDHYVDNVGMIRFQVIAYSQS